MIFTAATFKYVFDHHPEDIYWCTADIGWITGHSYLTYGPLANGATSVLVSSVWAGSLSWKVETSLLLNSLPWYLSVSVMSTSPCPRDPLFSLPHLKSALGVSAHAVR